MFIKVCGLTAHEHIDWGVELGYTAIGVVLHPPSPRYCSVEKARELARFASGRVKTVAVGMTYEEVEKVSDSFDFIQIYERKKISGLIYAGETVPAGLDFAYFMYDVSRGSGTSDEFPAWLYDMRNKLIISGGLAPGNVGDVLRRFPGCGIDVSSGVESVRGIKDYSLMKEFMKEVRHAIA
jgi:phosphoribosylanthranilate isomerase